MPGRHWPARHDHVRCGWAVAKRTMWPNGVVVLAPALDQHLRLGERVEHFAVQQLIPEVGSDTPIARTASATGLPCAVSTSTCRSLATICSGVLRFPASLNPATASPVSHSRRATSTGAGQSLLCRPAMAGRSSLRAERGEPYFR